MLARANLLRMRGQWTEAADLCAQVIHANAKNPTAHSLLGDIYQDQGQTEEARHWYQLALELNPASRADRAKLALTEEMLEARSQRAEWEAVIEGRAQPVATSLLVRESVQRVGALAGSALCAIILVMAVLVSLSERNSVNDAEGSAPGFLSFRRPSPRMVADTRRERDLLKKVVEMGPSDRALPVRVELDPRSQAAILRVYVLPGLREQMAAPEFKAMVMREGYRLARALLQAEDTLAVVNVSIVGPATLPDGSVDTERLLLGSLSRENLVVKPEKVTVQELQQFYNRVSPPLWAPDLSGV
jgi:hypothetical protein